jgi:hypothetical protein
MVNAENLAKHVVERYLSTLKQLVTTMELREEISKPFLSLLESTLSDTVRSVTEEQVSRLQLLSDENHRRRFGEVLKCFVKREGRLVNLRLREEYDKQESRRQQKAAAGVKGNAEMRKRYYLQPNSDLTQFSDPPGQHPEDDQSVSRQRPDPSISFSRSISTAPERGTRCRPDFLPNKEVIDYADLECPDLDAEKELATFLDYWIAMSGQKALKRDWNRTFRIWLRRGQAYFLDRNRSPLAMAAELDRRDELARRRAESAEHPESHEDDHLFDLSDDK